MTVVCVKMIVQSWLANGPKPMSTWGTLGMTCSDEAAGGRAVADARVALAIKCLGQPLAMQTDSNGRSLGVIVGDWGIGHKVVPIGARISDACVVSWKSRRGIWNKFSC